MNENEKKQLPGESGFMLVLAALCIFLLSGSVKLFRDDPQFSGAGGLPLILSAILTILAIVLLFQGVRSKNKEGKKSPGELLAFIFPKNIIVFILLLIAYCMALMFHVGFYPSTAVFLMAAMEYLDPKSWKWNLLTAGILLIVIYVAFSLLFKVQMP